MNRIIRRIEENPIIAAIRRETDVDAAVKSQVAAVFLLHADIFNIRPLVDSIKSYGKSVFIHVDFLEGLGRDRRAVDYIAQVIKPDGIISTGSSQIKYAREVGLFTVQRFFLVDSLSYETTIKAIQGTQPDMIEVMPAVMPGVIKRICSQVSTPVIAGGLIDTKEDIVEILRAGAVGASTGKKELWVL